MAKSKNSEVTTRIVGYKVMFPKIAANDKDPVTGKKCVAVSNSLTVFRIPVEEEAVVAVLPYKMLRDIAFPYLPAEDEPVVETVEVEAPAPVETPKAKEPSKEAKKAVKKSKAVEPVVEDKPVEDRGSSEPEAAEVAKEPKDEITPEATEPKSGKEA